MRRKHPAAKSAKKSGGSNIKIRKKSVLPKTDPNSSEPNLKKREGVPEMGTKPPRALRGYRASNRGSKKL